MQPDTATFYLQCLVWVVKFYKRIRQGSQTSITWCPQASLFSPRGAAETHCLFSLPLSYMALLCMLIRVMQSFLGEQQLSPCRWEGKQSRYTTWRKKNPPLLKLFVLVFNFSLRFRKCVDLEGAVGC